MYFCLRYLLTLVQVKTHTRQNTESYGIQRWSRKESMAMENVFVVCSTILSQQPYRLKLEGFGLEMTRRKVMVTVDKCWGRRDILFGLILVQDMWRSKPSCTVSLCFTLPLAYLPTAITITDLVAKILWILVICLTSSTCPSSLISNWWTEPMKILNI